MHWARSFVFLVSLVCPVSGPVASEGCCGEVDLALVLAADRSGSLSAAAARAQRAGFAAAFSDPALQRALGSGSAGRVAVVYFEWSGAGDQEVIVPWRVISGAAEAEGFARALEAAEVRAPGGGTSISGALDFAGALLAGAGFRAWRAVVDLSSNGRDSGGADLEAAQARLRGRGVTVNALVLPGRGFGGAGPYDMLFAPYDGPLAAYFEREVIAGPGSFAVAVDPAAGFAEAILRKLVLEVAWAAEGSGG